MLKYYSSVEKSSNTKLLMKTWTISELQFAFCNTKLKEQNSTRLYCDICSKWDKNQSLSKKTHHTHKRTLDQIFFLKVKSRHKFILGVFPLIYILKLCSQSFSSIYIYIYEIFSFFFWEGVAKKKIFFFFFFLLEILLKLFAIVFHLIRISSFIAIFFKF